MVKKKFKKINNSKKKSCGKVAATAPGDNFDCNEAKNLDANGDLDTSVTGSHCSHIALCQNLKSDDVRLAKQKSCCDECGEQDKGLWLCMSSECGRVLCGSKVRNHSDEHFKKNLTHSLQLSLRSNRIWCFLCDCEVLLHSNSPPFASSVISAISKGVQHELEMIPDITPHENKVELPSTREVVIKGKFARTLFPLRGRIFNDHGEARRAVIVSDTDGDDEDDEDEFSFPRGLTGLCNLGNTCYMNAALQALSNCLPLAEYFLSVPSVAPFVSHSLSKGCEPPLSRAFRMLLQKIWSRNRNGFTSPRTLLNQIRVHCPQFRGWGQQDAQEFIRCFLDLIHRELRQPVYSYEERYEKSLTQINKKRKSSSSLSSVNSPSNKTAADKAVDVPSSSSVRSNSSSSSSSRCSNSLDRYETADSGWSSDGDACSASVTSAAKSSAKKNKRCRSVSPKALEQVRNGSIRETSDILDNKQMLKDRTPIFGGISLEAPKSYRSIVSDVFDGQLRSTVKCFTCQHISETYETFQDLSLCIPTKEQLDRLSNTSCNKEGFIDCDSILSENSSKRGWLWWLGLGWLWSLYGYLYGSSITLVDTLNAFFSPDDLRDENMYSCEKCAKLRNGVKICRITRLPEVLCIHLKRFRHDSSYSTKVSTSVSFPLYDLDLSPFFNPTDKSKDEPALYDLCAFVTHRGRSAESGHYLAYCKNEYDNNWYEFDDTVVTRLETAGVLTKEAYVLFYQKKTTDQMQKVKEKIGMLLEQERLNDGKKISIPHYYVSREWLHRLSTFSHPGPITNYDFLCRHAQILPRKAADLVEHYAVIESPTWEYLFKKFGGGPTCTELHYCSKCQREHLWLQHKRDYEIKACKAIKSRSVQAATSPELTYNHYLPPNVISKSWLMKWRKFVDGESLVPPGPIDNRTLLVRSSSGEQFVAGSTNYVELPRELWLFFHSVYGGGPEVFCLFGPHPSEEEVAEMVAEAETRMKKALMLLKMKEGECCSETLVEVANHGGTDSSCRQGQEPVSCRSEVCSTVSYDNLLM